MSFNDFWNLGAIGTLIQNGADGSGVWQSTTVPTLLFLAIAVLCTVVPYLLGSVNFALIISQKEFHDDIRTHGSKNAGMTNMLRTYGKRAAVMTLAGDIGKAIIACLIGRAAFGVVGAYVAGMFCIIGHVFPIFFKFKGGKGVATVAAMILMTDWRTCLILLTVFVIIVLGTKYVSLASVMCMLLYPLVNRGVAVVFTVYYPGILNMVTLLVAVLIIWKHRENIQRLREGCESKISLGKSKKAKDTADGQ